MFTQINSTSFTSAPADFTPSNEIVSDELFSALHGGLRTVGMVVSAFGIITNIINIVVFSRQGFSDAATVSFLGLSVSDLGALLALLWSTLCDTPLIEQIPGLPFSVGDIQFVTGGYPRVGFSKIACWITIFIAIQRCLCAAFPLKIQSVMTPRTTAIIIIMIYVILFFLVVFPDTCTGGMKLVWKFYPSVNKTLLGLEFSSYAKTISTISSTINTVVQLISFILSVISTATLVALLKKRSVSLGKMTQSYKEISKKDSKTGRMIIFLSGIHILCYTPSTINVLLILFIPGFELDDVQQNFFYLTWTLSFLVEAANSSVTGFVYYIMSSKYRYTCRKILCCFPVQRNR